LKATRNSRKSVADAKASSLAKLAEPGQAGSKKVWKMTSVKDLVLKVTLRQYVIQNRRPDEPPKAGPSEREIMK
jgi:hypothetical protein